MVKFLTNYQYELASKTQSFEDKIALLERAIREKKNVEMLYLKSIDEKSKRTIQPTSVGEEEYGKRFWALREWMWKRMKSVCLVWERYWNLNYLMKISKKNIDHMLYH